jgi:hypothetical protein
MRRPGIQLLLLALASSVAVATAANPAAADDHATREAQARFEEGLARVRAGDFEAARVSFTQAYSVLRKPEILWDLALTEQRTGHQVEALTHFKQLRTSAVSATDRAGAAKHVTELMAQTAHIDVAAPSGSQVSVDGIVAGVAPLADAVDVSEGKHHVEIRTAAGATKAADADAVVGQVAHVTFLQADSSAPVVTGPSSPVDATPPAPEQPPADTGSATTAPSGPSFWDARKITVVTAGGLAVVSAAFGLAFGISSSNDANSAASLQQQISQQKPPQVPNCTVTTPACGTLATTRSSEHSAYVTSEGFWIASGVLAAGAVAAWFLWPQSPPSWNAAGRIQLVPTATPGGAGAFAVGSF